MRQDGLFRVQSELVSTAASSTEFSRTLPSSSQHLPHTTCASFLIDRLLHDREDGNQQPPLSPEFELDPWNDGDDDDNETENTDREFDSDDDDDDNDDEDECIGLNSKRTIQSSDHLP